MLIHRLLYCLLQKVCFLKLFGEEFNRLFEQKSEEQADYKCDYDICAELYEVHPIIALPVPHTHSLIAFITKVKGKYG